MTITTTIWCDNCIRSIRLSSSADPHNVVLRADGFQPGWKFNSDGTGHLCPDCDDYDEEALR